MFYMPNMVLKGKSLIKEKELYSLRKKRDF
jgi:hypothetical protein